MLKMKRKEIIDFFFVIREELDWLLCPKVYNIILHHWFVTSLSWSREVKQTRSETLGIITVPQHLIMIKMLQTIITFVSLTNY